MAKYLKEFETNAQYEAYINGNPDLPNVSLIDEDGSVKYNVKPDYSKQYLTFVALEDGTFKMTGNTIDYSLDKGETWATLSRNTNTPTIHQGEKIMWKNAQRQVDGSRGQFSSTGQFNVEGNVMSLIFGDNFEDKTDLTGEFSPFNSLFRQNRIISAENLILPATTLVRYCYQNMFHGCTNLTSAPELPATTLVGYCYSQMFNGCTNLTSAPELPAITLTNGCYQNMFNGCSSLTTAPELTATALTSSCYYQMFYNCSSLNYIKMLAQDIIAYQCLDGWVSGISATGTFVKAASATLPTGNNGIPSGWEVINA